MIRSARFSIASACAVSLVWSTTLLAHPSMDEMRRSDEERRQCQSALPGSERIDPVRLGFTSAQLRAAIVASSPESDATPHLDTAGPSGELTRIVRKVGEHVAQVEYELWKDRVYRVRWRLSTEYERPMPGEYARLASVCLGPPKLDQTIEAEPGSGNATIRRIAWAHDDRVIELRQLHPLRGGAVFLTITRESVLREIGLARQVPFPEPWTSGPWWRRTSRPIVPVDAEERSRLGVAFLRLLAQADH